MRPIVMPRQQPSGPPLVSPCASGGCVGVGVTGACGSSSVVSSATGAISSEIFGGSCSDSVDAGIYSDSDIGLLIYAGRRAGRNQLGQRGRDELAPTRVPGASKCAELAISGIAQAWQDVAAVVQAVVERADIDVDIRVRLCQLEQAIGRGDDSDV